MIVLTPCSGAGVSGPTTLSIEPAAGPIPVAPEFHDLARLLSENLRLEAALRKLGPRLLEARRYQDRDGASSALARARLEQLRARHTALRVRLRANRIEARTWVAGPLSLSQGA